MKKLLFGLTFFFSFLMFIAQSVMAQEIDGVYYDWTVFKLEEEGRQKKCYIASFPKKKIGNHKVERKPYVLIARYENKKIEEASIFNDYEYKINSEIYVAIGDKQYRLFTEGDVAWTKTMQQDKEMIKDMLKGDVMKVRGESSIGTYSVDEYSLRGITRAYRRMKELCNE